MNYEKDIKFHELLIRKAEIEVEFWQKEVKFQEKKLLKLRNMSEEFIS